MIKPVDTEFIHILMELFIKEIGAKINKKDKVLKHGPMDQNMKEFINRDKRMVFLLD